MAEEKGNLALAIAVVVGFTAVITLGLYLIYDKSLITSLFTKKQEKPVACAQEAKVCPDGSSVGRTGPNCEFADCPTVKPQDETAGWQTYKNDQYGFEIKYPKNFSVNKNSTTDNIVLDYDNYGQNSFSVKVKSYTASLEQNVKKYVKDSQKASASAAAPLTVTYKPYIVSNLNGYLITEQSGDVPVNTSVTLKIQKENNIFSFNYSYQGYILRENPSDVLGGPPIPAGFQDEVQAKLKAYNEIQTIISTFKFTK
ncbi:MAG: hypothetical protein HY219_02765 [Candidatus Staskawiczbacteria bacterium]|nr:hypothetical protein [Candidatus Staskawiczbacteria bacterium]